jgi:adenosylcobinamide kinase/adenosylcobinamide-phosphate guanylyltransferase
VAADPSAVPLRGLVLISGPSRSGKSRWAEHLAQSSGRSVIYVATGPLRPSDASWQERLRLHRQRRPASWRCREVGGALVDHLIELRQAPPSSDALEQRPLLLIDSLGTWLSHHLERDPEAWAALQHQLLEQLRGLHQPVLLVCEEVGWGVVPPTAIGGLFRDRLGALQQKLMAQSQAAWLVVQGRALDLHALGTPVPEA